ncbi:protein mab-21-like 3 isoform X2 [Hemicordylus capensis]|uniref:protein mab-21-like 3 isoform X2 n=1 Tax=Hemicordylus capensis TaxID=884348 RepID=UPI002302A4EF|nr:protein mab-21-like 3 isoform X2 [Hemicordylus capensis]
MLPCEVCKYLHAHFSLPPHTHFPPLYCKWEGRELRPEMGALGNLPSTTCSSRMVMQERESKYFGGTKEEKAKLEILQLFLCIRRQAPAMKPLTEEAVEQYIQNQVDLRHRMVSKAVDEVQKIILQLTTEISNKDSRFQAISNSGIHNENMKVLAPSQFLITIPLLGLMGYKERQVRHWRYYTAHGAKLLSPVRDPEELQQWLEVEQFSQSVQQWHETDVNIEGDLVPAKVLAVFRELVEKSILSCHLTDRVSTLEGSSSVVRVAVETSSFQVDVELAPTIEIPTCWPQKIKWPRCLKRWPSQEKVQCVKSFGFDLLASSNYHWQLSFSRAEHILMEGLDEDGGCRMKCFRVMRQMKEDVWCAGNKHILTTFHLQMVLFWTCEKYPRSKDWRCFHKGFLRMVRKLHKCVSQHFLKHYFIKDTNLLKYTNTNDLDVVAGKLTVFLENPMLPLN